MVTRVPAGPEVGFRLVILGAGGAVGVTVNVTPLLATPPVVTITLPVVAALGTEATMLVSLQLVALAAAPLKLTVLVPCVAPKLVPVMVTEVPAGPEVGLMAVICGPAVPPLAAGLNAATIAPHASEVAIEALAEAAPAACWI
jgi:hypothetical protein